MEKEPITTSDIIFSIVALALLIVHFTFMILMIFDFSFMRFWIPTYLFLFIFIIIALNFSKKMKDRLYNYLGRIRFIAFNFMLIAISGVFLYFTILSILNWNISPDTYFILTITMGITFGIVGGIGLFLYIFEDSIQDFLNRENEYYDEEHIIKEM